MNILRTLGFKIIIYYKINYSKLNGKFWIKWKYFLPRSELTQETSNIYKQFSLSRLELTYHVIPFLNYILYNKNYILFYAFCAVISFQKI